MPKYTDLKLKKIRDQYNELTRDSTFDKAPFNALSDSDRVMFATELVESQARYDRDQEIIKQNSKIISGINDVYYAAR